MPSKDCFFLGGRVGSSGQRNRVARAETARKVAKKMSLDPADSGMKEAMHSVSSHHAALREGSAETSSSSVSRSDWFKVASVVQVRADVLLDRLREGERTGTRTGYYV